MSEKDLPYIERRASNRLEPPSCPQCGAKTGAVGVARTTRFVYFRCTACNELLAKTMPGIKRTDLLDTLWP